MRDIKVAAVQFEHTPGNKQANLSKIRRFVERASEQRVEIIVVGYPLDSGNHNL